MTDKKEEQPTRTLTLTHGEINALEKALLYLKFECEETASLIFTGSPLINSAFDKIAEAHYLSKYSRDFYSKRSPHAEAFIRQKIAKQEQESGRKTDEEIREIYVAECLHPFPYS